MKAISTWFGAMGLAALIAEPAGGALAHGGHDKTPAAAASAPNGAVGFRPGMNYSNGRIAGQTLYIAGQAGADGPDVRSKDITAQTTTSLNAIENILKSAGYQMSDVVSMTVYMTDISEFPQMNEVYRKFVPDPKPTRTTIQVVSVVGGAKVEISAIAVK